MNSGDLQLHNLLQLFCRAPTTNHFPLVTASLDAGFLFFPCLAACLFVLFLRCVCLPSPIRLSSLRAKPNCAPPLDIISSSSLVPRIPPCPKSTDQRQICLRQGSASPIYPINLPWFGLSVLAPTTHFSSSFSEGDRRRGFHRPCRCPQQQTDQRDQQTSLLAFLPTSLPKTIFLIFRSLAHVHRPALASLAPTQETGSKAAFLGAETCIDLTSGFETIGLTTVDSAVCTVYSRRIANSSTAKV